MRHSQPLYDGDSRIRKNSIFQCQCQLTLGCAGTAKATDKGSDYITPQLHTARPANPGGLRMLYLWPNPFSSFSPRRPRVDFANLTSYHSTIPIPTERPTVTLESTHVQLNSISPESKCNRHRPVWQRPAVAHRRRTGMPARTVSGPNANACMAIMLAHARGMLLSHRSTCTMCPWLGLAHVGPRPSLNMTNCERPSWLPCL